ncbi:LOW QUALITY PROTEIN: transcription termination protein NusA [Geomicrobium sp. JCM 19039]|nr:LOW QUALITY PROTEIN: transcription termination protein NusA [Geomicrobium sp. JCM 19039]
MSQEITQAVERLAKPILDELEMELVDVEYKKEGSNWFLRLFIDHPNGMGLDECSLVSERVSEVLDKEDPIEGFYYLEVSSPGAERPLKKPADFENAVGKKVYVKTYEPIEVEKKFKATLTEYEEGELTVEVIDKTRKSLVAVPESKVAKARLSVL